MRRILVALITLSFSNTTHAQDWPQWLGPERNGSIPATIAPWKGTLDVAWKAPVGEGHSSPIVAGGRVYLHHKAAGIDEEVVTCWDLAGKQVWESSYARGEFRPQFGAGPRATPCVADGKLYTFGVTGILVCWDAASGKQLWKTNLLEKFSAKNLFFGISSSPLVVGRYVYLMPGGPKASIVAFDKETGEVAWQTGSDAASYASPIVTTIGDKQVIVFLTREGLVGLDDKTGKEYFRVPLRDALNESSTTPVRVGDLLIASSVTFGSLGAKLGSLDGQPVATQDWKDPKLTCYFGTPVEFGGLLYVVTGRILNPTATLHCIDPKTGKVLWSKPGVGKYHATVLRTKDKVLLLEEAGDLVLLEPSDKEYKELARAKLCGNTWAHPGWANGLFVIRDEKELIAVKLPASKAE
jgi:outer membrane protein assembly factor BamB